MKLVPQLKTLQSSTILMVLWTILLRLRLRMYLRYDDLIRKVFFCHLFVFELVDHVDLELWELHDKHYFSESCWSNRQRVIRNWRGKRIYFKYLRSLETPTSEFIRYDLLCILDDQIFLIIDFISRKSVSILSNTISGRASPSIPKKSKLPPRPDDYDDYWYQDDETGEWRNEYDDEGRYKLLLKFLG